jgi:hypothetical protein
MRPSPYLQFKRRLKKRLAYIFDMLVYWFSQDSEGKRQLKRMEVAMGCPVCGYSDCICVKGE